MYIILFFTLLTYIFLICFNKYRTAIAMIGTGVLLIIGVIGNYFDVASAFACFPSEVFILIAVLALFTDIFNRTHLIDWIGYKFIHLTKGKRTLFMIGIPLLMYATSLFMNNLTVILLFVSMVLFLAIDYHLPIVPLIVSMVIGSNIGGAPLPWADTPAVVLTLYTDFSLVDFLNKLFLPCLFFAILLSIYSFLVYKFFSPKFRETPFKNKPHVHKHDLVVPLILFILFIIGVSIAPFYNISIAYVSLITGGFLIIADKKNPMDSLNDLPIMDSILFIASLFIIGGILHSSGILDIAAQYILGLTNSSPYFILLAVLSIAFIIATFLSAGPAAATLLPICTTLDIIIPNHLVYAALALGILAGSSMLPWSATGGPILLSQVHLFLHHSPLPSKERKNIEKIFSLKHYICFSIPFSLLIYMISGFYLVGYLRFILYVS